MESGPSNMPPLNQLAIALAMGSSLYLGAWMTSRVRVRVRRPRVGLLGGCLSLLGVALGACPPAGAGAPAASSRTGGPRPASPPPWTRSGEIVPIPPRPPDRAGAAPWSHPAAHAAQLPAHARPPALFGRARPGADTPRFSRAVRDPHRAGATDSAVGEAHVTHYEVLPGDTLWDIAARVLDTQDVRRIARFWPALHRSNRDVIGADPNRIYPGQVLRVPVERP